MRVAARARRVLHGASMEAHVGATATVETTVIRGNDDD
jgi:hypothetical protein